MAVANRRFHARELERLTGLRALEGQAQLLLNDLHEYQTWLEAFERRDLTDQQGGRALAAGRPPADPGGDRAGDRRPERDALQAYCDVLEEKWILSELSGRDVGLEAAIDAYLGLGAPAPETDPTAEAPIALDIDWASGWDADDSTLRGRRRGWHHGHPRRGPSMTIASRDRPGHPGAWA